ncbi:MAG TPA: type II secretion system F family protein [Stellaceae bacterium]
MSDPAAAAAAASSLSSGAAGPLLLGAGILASAVALTLAFEGGGGQRRMTKRLERLRQRGAVAASGGRRGANERSSALVLRRDRSEGLDALFHRVLPRPDVLRQRLSRTGTRLNLAGYAMLCLAAASVGFLLLTALAGFAAPAAALGAAALGLWLPHLVVLRLIAKRRSRFEALFPDAIGLMVRGLKSGLPATETIGIIGTEIAGPVGEEFRRIADQIRVGMPFEQALWDAARRIDITEFNFFVISMAVQRETGGNLAETLENLDSILRRRRQMKLKVKAMSSEARASAAIIGSLPFVMFGLLFVIGRSYVGTLLTTSTGHMLLAVGGVSMLLGFVVIARMVRFEI